jgi:uncharacterized SAM-binding protein YcdF (DUF218 family)
MSTPARVAKRLFLAAIAIAILVWLASLVSVILWSRRDTARPASAIVVLGAAQYVGHPSPVLRARLDHAVALFKRGFAPRLIFTGGTGKGDTTSEAAVGRAYALKRGVPDSVILMENEGRTTRESLQGVASIMREHDMKTAIFVSDPFHMARLRVIAHDLGIEPYTSPTPTSPISASRQAWRYMFNESLKVPVTWVTDTP